MQIVPLHLSRPADLEPVTRSAGRPATALQRIGAAIKELALPDNWRDLIGGLVMLPGSNRDYSKTLAQAHLNAVVSICLRWVLDNFPEPELQVVEADAEGEEHPVEGHPLIALLEEPNPWEDGDTLLGAGAMSYLLTGNAWFYKARGLNGHGQVRELYWLPHWAVRPYREPGRTEPLTAWSYSVNGRWVTLPREDVIHIQFGKDPDDPRLGWSRLRAVARAIGADSEADTYEQAILENLGIPGFMVSPKENVSFDAEKRKNFLELFKSKIRGDQRGEPIASSVPINVERLAFSPEELALDRMRIQPISRICGAIGVHPMAVNLAVGNGPSAFDNGGQHQAAREASYHDCLIPLQRRFAKSFTRELLREMDQNPRRRARWCYDDVPVLQEDKDAKHRRVREDYRAGLLRQNEARGENGYSDLGPEGEKFFSIPGRPATAPGTPPAGETDPKELTDEKKVRPLIEQLRAAREKARQAAQEPAE